MERRSNRLSRWVHKQHDALSESWFRYCLYSDAWGGWILEAMPRYIPYEGVAGWQWRGPSYDSPLYPANDAEQAKAAADAWASASGYTLTDDEPRPNTKREPTP